jgi:hypothetical protein
MTDDHHVGRNMHLNENYSWTMSSSRFSVNKKTTQNNHILLIFGVAKCVIGNVAINIYGDRDPLG